MNKLKFIYACLIALMGLCLASCSDNGPDGPSSKTDYNKLRIGRMDLSGAVSVGLKNEDSSRAIDGEYLSSGMYKIDADGNISAVAVYFTTDTLGNRLEHEEKLRIVPEELFNISDNYLMVTNCSYYDSDGDKVSDKWEYNEDTDESKWIKQDVPYKHLLVRKSDGKIWCVDNISETILNTGHSETSLNGGFRESNRGDLYFIVFGAYKFNLSSDNASFEQITTGDGAFFFGDANWIVTDNGVIGGYHNHYSTPTLYFGWPHSGFISHYNGEYIESISGDFPSSIPVGNLNVARVERGDTIYISKFDELKFRLTVRNNHPNVTLLHNHNKLFMLVSPQYRLTCDIYIPEGYGYNKTTDEVLNTINKIAYENLPLPKIYNVTPGEKTGEIAFNRIAELNKWNDYRLYKLDKRTNSNYYYLTYGGSDPEREDNIQTIWSGDNLYVIINNYLTLWNLKNNEWNVIKKIESDQYDTEYQGKLWKIVTDKNDANFGAYWLDINTIESGVVKFNVTLPDYVRYKDYSNGILTYSGVDPATSNRVYFYIDITTGEAVNEVNTPELLFSTIVPLN